MPDEHDVEGFLLEYRTLCEKYRIIIAGCGCCGSPFLSGVGSDEDLEVFLSANIRRLRKEWKG